ncbi:MAG TPA: helix-turn-helix domain-containing protein [Candidatus Competibacteraceae bacterium]|nr:MAG: DNA-binding protein [Candidatus Competibacteraceae bacterium]HOB62904.1 helix-turn-helix domain-containing protein [Candidatus Competibacteraceae bacterium]HQA26364.1 helix-turn-helix domain-containing protein [Candidatus Competibacteraceae bacterium]
MENQPIQRRLLTDPEAATYLGVSLSFLRQGRMEGRRANRSPGPPFIRMGRAIRYDLQDLDAWLAANRREVA